MQESKELSDLRALALYTKDGTPTGCGRVSKEVTVRFDPSAVYIRDCEKDCPEFAADVIFKLDADMSKESKSEKKEESKKKLETFPDWFVNLQSIQPGMPPLLYAIAYKKHHKNIPEASQAFLDSRTCALYLAL